MEAPNTSAAPKMVAMTLLKNYRPKDENTYEIVGHERAAVMEKGPDGTMKVVKPEEFIAGEMAPAPVPGAVGYEHKIWAGTKIRLPEDEARAIKKAGIANFELD